MLRRAVRTYLLPGQRGLSRLADAVTVTFFLRIFPCESQRVKYPALPLPKPNIEHQGRCS